ncbi:MAG: hypothetical protein ABIL62_14005 [Planctomycetota bacterium]
MTTRESKITDHEIKQAAEKLGCNQREVKWYVNKYGRIDLNELSVSILGKPYVPRVPERQEPKCPRCHWPVSECNCSEKTQKKNRVLWESKR